MAAVKNLQFGFGSVRYIAKIDEIPASSETQGNVTINNMGSPGKPAYFEVSFTIHYDVEVNGSQAQNYVNLTIPFPNNEASTPYLEVESEAASSLPSLLRNLADSVDAEIERFEGKSTVAD